MSNRTISEVFCWTHAHKNSDGSESELKKGGTFESYESHSMIYQNMALDKQFRDAWASVTTMSLDCEAAPMTRPSHLIAVPFVPILLLLLAPALGVPTGTSWPAASVCASCAALWAKRMR